MKKLNLAVLGATGAVGREMLAVLEERNFPVNNLLLLSSERSAGKEIIWRGEKFVTADAAKSDFSNIDVMLGAVSADLSRLYSPKAAEKGAVVIDNSSAYRMDEGVPLVVPEINPGDISRHKGIIANPNCTTIITLTAVSPLNAYSPIKRMTASSYQAISGAGAEAIAELEGQMADYAANRPLSARVFDYPILHNIIPHIGDMTENGYTKEELKLANESRKILHSPDVRISCTCVRVPVIRSHSVSVSLEFESGISVDKAREILSGAPGVVLSDDGVYPMPINVSGQDMVFVGRIRKDLSSESGLCLWCCGDQLRKGAATNAVQIAELIY